MKVIAFAGVSGAGKSTLIKDLQEELGYDRCSVLDEPSVGEVFKYLGFPLSFNSKLENTARVARHDFGRVEYQMLYENQHINRMEHTNKIVFIDKAVPCLLVYALTMSARFAGDNLDGLIREVQSHCSLYDAMIYLPYRNFDTSRDNLERRVLDRHVLETQDVVLGRMLTWLPEFAFEVAGSRKSNLKIVRNYLVAAGIIERENVSSYHI